MILQKDFEKGITRVTSLLYRAMPWNVEAVLNR
jgi:hypothetical protein